MDIVNEIKELKDNSKKLEVELISIKNLLYEGNDVILPITLISNTLEDLKKTSDKQTKVLEAQQSHISQINHEAIKARNQMIYMFLTLLGTLLCKFVFSYVTG